MWLKRKQQKQNFGVLPQKKDEGRNNLLQEI